MTQDLTQPSLPPLSHSHPFVDADQRVDVEWYSWLDRLAEKVMGIDAAVTTGSPGAAVAWGSFYTENATTPVTVRRAFNLGTPTILGSGTSDWVFRCPFTTPLTDNKYMVTGSAISLDSSIPVFICGLTAGYVAGSFDVWICNLSGQHVSALTFFNVLVHWRP